MPNLAWGPLLSVSIGGVSRTADVVGAGEIDRELDAAGLATVRLKGAMPAVGAAVAIGGLTTPGYVGVVDTVTYDPQNRCWIVWCTDGLQAGFEALSTPAAVLALLPSGAIWHESLFGAWSDGWECARDAMSTVPYSIYKESGTLHSVAWAGTGYTSEIVHASGGIYDQSVTLDVAAGRDLISQITATVEIQYSRHHHHALAINWACTLPVGGPDDCEPSPGVGEPWDFCYWANYPWTLPTKQMAADAINGQPWSLIGGDGLQSPLDPNEIAGIRLTGLPETGVYCGTIWNILGAAEDNGFVWINTASDSLTDYCIAFSAKLGRAWAQTVVQTWTITVHGPTGTPGVATTEQASYSSPADDAGYEAAPANRIPGVSSGWTVGVGSGQHHYRDRLDPLESAKVLTGMAQLCATQIRKSHRGTRLSVRVQPLAEPALGSRCRITAEDIQATGQVERLLTSWDIESHDCGTSVTIAVTSGTTAADNFALGTGPDTTPGYTLDAAIHLATHIGRIDGCDDFDPEWTNCWVGNRRLGLLFCANPGEPVYPEGILIQTPDVPDAARDELAASASATFEIATLAGTLTISTP